MKACEKGQSQLVGLCGTVLLYFEYLLCICIQ